MATFGELLGPTSLAKGARAMARSRVHQGRPIGNQAQLGGSLVVSPDGSIPFAHMSEDASDNATLQDLLAAARGAAGSR